MAIIKCKMCGGDLTVAEDASIAECEYCGTMQTVPNQDNEKKLTLFSRANRLRLACEFDKASGVYENIVSEFPEEAEAYWGLVLCYYGIEYVDDPATGKKVPTCHRSSFHSVLENSDFEQACENADAVARRVYRDEAKTIEEIRKGILEVSGKEPPYDIFICYKETDENGDRTIDSVLAQDIFDALSAKGYRVFFSRITLEDKLGTEYEPYIFAALNSAKVMLVFGTDYEYFNAVWVKNEWSRFLKLMAQDKRKHLIPCYKDVDAYDMPKEFQKLQGQDLSKVGAIQDLLRGIDKLLKSDETQDAPSAAPQIAAEGPTASSLLKRGQMFLEESAWESAKEYFDKVLDINPECAEAYLGLFCVERKYRSAEQIAEDPASLSDSLNKEKALRFAAPTLLAKLESWLDAAVRLAEELQRQKEEQHSQGKRRFYALRSFIPLIQNLLVTSDYCTIGLRSDGTVIAAGSNSYGQSNVSDWRNIATIIARNDRTVGLRFDGTVVAAGSNSSGQCSVSNWRDIVAVGVGGHHTVGLQSDGTVVATGDNRDGQCNVSDWKDIVAIEVGPAHTVGLRSDGTVVATGDNSYGQCNVSDWRNVTAIFVGYEYTVTVGLRSDGTVVATGNNRHGQCDVSDWRNITAIFVGSRHTVGLRSDGTVVAAGDNRHGECNVSDWKDIVDIVVRTNYTAGLRSDGTVVETAKTGHGECNVSDWKDIVAIGVGHEHTVGLRSDGTVVAVGYNFHGECNVSNWKDIAAIRVEGRRTIGLRFDGTVVATGVNDYGECNVSDWQLFSSAEELAEQQVALRERGEKVRQAEARRRAEEAQRRQAEERAACKARLVQEQAQLQNELANLKGLFTGKRRREIEARLSWIRTEMKKYV